MASLGHDESMLKLSWKLIATCYMNYFMNFVMKRKTTKIRCPHLSLYKPLDLLSAGLMLDLHDVCRRPHYNDVITGAMASQITSLAIVYSTVYSGADQRKHQSPASLAFVWGIHRWPVNSPHKWPVTRKIFPFDDVIIYHPTLLCRQSICRSSADGWQLLLTIPDVSRQYVKTTPLFPTGYLTHSGPAFLLCNDVSHWVGASLA